MQKNWIREKSRNDNPVAIVKNIVHFHGVNLSNNSIERSFDRISFPPSLFIMQQFLKEWMFDSNYVRLDVNSLKGVLYPAIACMDNKFVLLIKSTQRSILYLDTESGWKLDDLKSFDEKWNQELLMVTPSNFCGEMDFIEIKEDMQ